MPENLENQFNNKPATISLDIPFPPDRISSASQNHIFTIKIQRNQRYGQRINTIQCETNQLLFISFLKRFIKSPLGEIRRSSLQKFTSAKSTKTKGNLNSFHTESLKTFLPPENKIPRINNITTHGMKCKTYDKFLNACTNPK